MGYIYIYIYLKYWYIDGEYRIYLWRYNLFDGAAKPG